MGAKRKKMTIAVTGHRPSKLGNEYDLVGKYSDHIRKRLQDVINEYNPESIISGMALGVDTIWAKLGISNNLRVIAAIPCLNQGNIWAKIAKATYKEILDHPFVTSHYVSDSEFTMYCMQNRNKWMVDNCDLLVGVWDGTSGGTKNCIDYARKKKTSVLIINPNPS